MRKERLQQPVREITNCQYNLVAAHSRFFFWFFVYSLAALAERPVFFKEQKSL
jgi:hypothetical protein